MTEYKTLVAAIASIEHNLCSICKAEHEFPSVKCDLMFEPIQIKNHAHFKRILQEGKVKLEILKFTNLSNSRFYVGLVRSIRKADTTGVYLVAEGDESRGSFLAYDKAKDWVFDGDIATSTTYGYSYKLTKG